MTFAAGDVVVLKSGGIAMTVIEVEDEEAVCLWTGEDGDLFRESIPMIALLAAHALDEDEDNAEEESKEESEEEDENEEAEAKEKATAA